MSQRHWNALGVMLVGCGGAGTSAPPATLEVPKLAATAASEPPGAIRFGRQPVKVGDHRQTIVHAKSTAVNVATGDDVVIYESRFDEDVLAVEGPAASRVSVKFEQNSLSENGTTTPTSIDHKAYVVDLHPPSVVDAATKAPPSEDEITRVLDIVPDLGTRTTIEQVLAGRAYLERDRVDELAEAIVRILHPRFWHLDFGLATLGHATSSHADFAVIVRATSLQTGMKIDVQGDVFIHVPDSQLAQFQLAGTFTRSNGDEGEIELSRSVPTVGSP